MSKRSKKKKQVQLSKTPPSFQLSFSAVEFIAGHDGLLRGDPEAVFAIAMFGLVGGTLTLLGRKLLKLNPSEKFPFTQKIKEELKGAFPSGASAILVLVVAFEEDNSKDVNHFYQFISSMGEVQVWRSDEKIPTPIFLHDTIDWPSEELQSHSIEMMHQRKELREQYTSDEWIGAGLFWVSFEDKSIEKSFRSHFVSQDKKNDWVLFAEMKVKP